MRESRFALGVVLITTLARIDVDAGAVSQAAAQPLTQSDASLASVSAVAEVEDFCCPEYLAAVVAHIKRNWTPPALGHSPATAGVKFTIASDGRVSEVSLEKRSGNGILDMGALHAMTTIRQLPPLPTGFRQWSLTVRVAFDYGKPASHTAGPEIRFDTRGVEFGPWIRHFMAAIKSHWAVPASALSATGQVTVTFHVHKNGMISDITVSKLSFFDVFNSAAARAIIASDPTEPLPDAYPAEKVLFTVDFFYNDRRPRD
jgi:TonB family protein